jgi:hypothetical protein
VNFKNALEQNLFEAATRVCGANASIEHNKTIQIEVATTREVASFAGPPKKEIDVITAGFKQNPGVKILVSSKDFGNSKAEPAHVQEWAAVVKAMNQYSGGTKYVGLIVSPSGFTRGCEPWASAYNLGLIPPLKGKKLSFPLTTTIQMFERVLGAFDKRLHFPNEVLFDAPHFYEFVYDITEAFEGRDEAIKDSGGRYKLLPKGWVSSFGEVYRTFNDKAVEEIKVTPAGICLTFPDDLVFRVSGAEIVFGPDDKGCEGPAIAITCEKNLFGEPCSFEFIRNLVVGQSVVSAGDWGHRFEFGLTDDLLLAIEPARLQIIRAKNPIDDNLL